MQNIYKNQKNILTYFHIYSESFDDNINDVISNVELLSNKKDYNWSEPEQYDTGYRLISNQVISNTIIHWEDFLGIFYIEFAIDPPVLQLNNNCYNIMSQVDINSDQNETRNNNVIAYCHRVKLTISNICQVPPVKVDIPVVPLQFEIIKHIDNKPLTNNDPKFLFTIDELDNNYNNLGTIGTMITDNMTSKAKYEKKYTSEELKITKENPIIYKLYKINESVNNQYNIELPHFDVDQQDIYDKWKINQTRYNIYKGYYILVKFELINNKIEYHKWYTNFPITPSEMEQYFNNNYLDDINKPQYSDFQKPHIINNQTINKQEIIMPESGLNNYIIILLSGIIILTNATLYFTKLNYNNM